MIISYIYILDTVRFSPKESAHGVGILGEGIGLVQTGERTGDNRRAKTQCWSKNAVLIVRSCKTIHVKTLRPGKKNHDSSQQKNSIGLIERVPKSSLHVTST